MGMTTAQFRRPGRETNVNPNDMSPANRAEWERRERKRVARLRSEFGSDPEMASASTTGGEAWSDGDRRRGPRTASLRSRLLAVLATRVGQIVTSLELAQALGYAATCSAVSKCISKLARERVLERTKYGVYWVTGRAKNASKIRDD